MMMNCLISLSPAKYLEENLIATISCLCTIGWETTRYSGQPSDAMNSSEDIVLVLLTAKPFIFTLFAVWYQEKIAKI